MKKLLPLVLLAAGCANGTLTPQGVQGVTAGVELALCVLDNYAVDTSAGMPAPQVVVDIINKCGTDEMTITKILTEHKKAEDAEKAGK